jgi:hypothetical protein
MENALTLLAGLLLVVTLLLLHHIHRTARALKVHARVINDLFDMTYDLYRRVKRRESLKDAGLEKFLVKLRSLYSQLEGLSQDFPEQPCSGK